MKNQDEILKILAKVGKKLGKGLQNVPDFSKDIKDTKNIFLFDLIEEQKIWPISKQIPMEQLTSCPHNKRSEETYSVRALLVSSDVEVFTGTFLNAFDAQKWALKIVNSPLRMDLSFELVLTDMSTSETMQILNYR
jgi:hypothetical protein